MAQSYCARVSCQPNWLTSIEYGAKIFFCLFVSSVYDSLVSISELETFSHSKFSPVFRPHLAVKVCADFWKIARQQLMFRWPFHGVLGSKENLLLLSIFKKKKQTRAKSLRTAGQLLIRQKNIAFSD